MDDKEANRIIEQALKVIDDFKSWHGTEKFEQSDMENLLKEVVRILDQFEK